MPKTANTCQISWVKNWSKLESKIGPSMLRDIIGPILDSRKWSFLTTFWDLFFEKKNPSHCRKKILKKAKKGQLGTILTQKRQFGPIVDYKHFPLESLKTPETPTAFSSFLNSLRSFLWNSRNPTSHSDKRSSQYQKRTKHNVCNSLAKRVKWGNFWQNSLSLLKLSSLTPTYLVSAQRLYPSCQALPHSQSEGCWPSLLIWWGYLVFALSFLSNRSVLNEFNIAAMHLYVVMPSQLA